MIANVMCNNSDAPRPARPPWPMKRANGSFPGCWRSAEDPGDEESKGRERATPWLSAGSWKDKTLLRSLVCIPLADWS
jgi:hypothetical protein